MRSTTCWIDARWLAPAAAAMLLLLSGPGCASRPPATFPAGLDAAAVRAQARDAHLTYAHGFPGLRVDRALRGRLDAALAAEDPAEAKRTGDAFLANAHAAALRVVPAELARLPEADRRALVDAYAPATDPDPAALFAVYREETDAGVDALRRDLAHAADREQIRAVLAPVRGGLETPPALAGRFGRWAPWFLFTVPSNLAIHHLYATESRGDPDRAFAAATVYRPQNPEAFDAAEATPRERALLARFAPVVVQEASAGDAAYDAAVDRLGRLTTPTATTVAVPTDEARVYAFAREVVVGGGELTQLSYALWYPEQPPAPGRESDPEAGPVDGCTLRVTLDARDRPLAFETLDNCGCYHRFYPSARLEAAAVGQYGAPQKDRSLSIERRVRGRYDLIVPMAIDVPDARSPETARPVIRVAARWHGIIGVGFDADEWPGEAHADAGYTLTPYADLELTRTDDGGSASVFYDNGLVKNAQRGEGVYFTPAGMLSAGQSRQRGTQLIEWDDWDLDDPDLFVLALRWPSPLPEPRPATP